MTRDRSDDIGFWVGVGVFALVVLAIYAAYRLLLPEVGDSWATLILYIPAFCAVFVIAPVQWRVSHFLLRRYCRKHGHAPREFLGDAHGDMICERCRAFLPRQSATPASQTG